MPSGNLFAKQDGGSGVEGRRRIGRVGCGGCGLLGLVQLHGRREEGGIPLREKVALEEEASGELIVEYRAYRII